MAQDSNLINQFSSEFDAKDFFTKLLQNNTNYIDDGFLNNFNLSSDAKQYLINECKFIVETDSRRYGNGVSYGKIYYYNKILIESIFRTRILGFPF